MKAFALLLFLAMAMCIVSCSKPQEPAIIGRWHEVGTSAVAAFHEDGTVELSDGQAQVSGTYSFITPSKLKLQLSGKGEALGPRVYEVAVATDKMSWIDVDGQKSDYLRSQ